MKRGRVIGVQHHEDNSTRAPDIVVRIDDRERFTNPEQEVGKIVEVYESGEEPLTLWDSSQGGEVMKVAIRSLDIAEDPLALKPTWRSEIKGLTVLVQRRGPGDPKQLLVFARQSDLDEARGAVAEAHRLFAAKEEVMRTTTDKLRELLDDALRRNPAAEAPVRHVVSYRAELEASLERCRNLEAEIAQRREADERTTKQVSDLVQSNAQLHLERDAAVANLRAAHDERDRLQARLDALGAGLPKTPAPLVGSPEDEIDRLVRLNNQLTAQINAFNARDDRDVDNRARERFSAMYKQYEAEKLAELEKKALAYFDRDLRIVQDGMTNGKRAIDALMQRVKLYAPPEPEGSGEVNTDEFDEDDDYYTSDEEEGG